MTRLPFPGSSLAWASETNGPGAARTRDARRTVATSQCSAVAAPVSGFPLPHPGRVTDNSPGQRRFHLLSIPKRLPPGVGVPVIIFSAAQPYITQSNLSAPLKNRWLCASVVNSVNVFCFSGSGAGIRHPCKGLRYRCAWL